MVGARESGVFESQALLYNIIFTFSLSLSLFRPFWLSPCQVMIVPVASRFDEYGLQVSLKCVVDHGHIKFAPTHFYNFF